MTTKTDRVAASMGSVILYGLGRDTGQGEQDPQHPTPHSTRAQIDAKIADVSEWFPSDDGPEDASRRVATDDEEEEEEGSSKMSLENFCCHSGDCPEEAVLDGAFFGAPICYHDAGTCLCDDLGYNSAAARQSHMSHCSVCRLTFCLDHLIQFRHLSDPKYWECGPCRKKRLDRRAKIKDRW